MSWKRKENGWWLAKRQHSVPFQNVNKNIGITAKNGSRKRKELWEIHRANDIDGNMENKLQKVQYLGNKKSAGDPLKVK